MKRNVRNSLDILTV